MTTTPPTRVYFDTSAFSALWKPTSTIPERTLLRVRRRMVSPLWDRQPVVIISVTLLDELAAAHEGGPEVVARLRENVEFLAGCGCRMPLAPDGSVKAEIQGRQGLWADPDELGRLLEKVVEDRALIADERRPFAGRKDDWLRGEKQAKDRLLAELGGQAGIGRMITGWFRNREAHVEDWCRDDMRKNASAWGLPADEAQWPDPRKIRTLWAFTSYKLARLVLLHQAQVRKDHTEKKLDQNDLPDQDHYVFTAHADVLVSEDRRFREIADLCPAPKPRVMSLAEWVAEVLGPQADEAPRPEGSEP